MLFIYIGVFYFTYYREFQREEYFLNQELIQLNKQLTNIINSYDIISEIIYRKDIDNAEIKSILYNALYDKKNRDIYRAELIDKLEADYNKLNEYRIRQLHFHFKDGTSFLRMHRPDKYGDSLFEVRKTVKTANLEKKKVVGFEEGRIFNGYRYVYPLSYNNHHIGTVEISVSFLAAAEMLKEDFSKIGTLLIKDEIIEEKVFKEENSNYQKCCSIENYSFDKGFLEIFNDQEVINRDFMREFNKKNTEEINKKLETGSDFFVADKIDGKYYTASFINIENFNQESAAYFVSYSESKILEYFRSNFWLKVIILTASTILTTYLVFKLFKFNEKLHHLAQRDQLTDIYNRYKIEDVLETELERSIRYGDSFSVLLLDIDYFKKVNDNYGHNTGDQILKQLSSLIEKNIRKIDTFGRWGGEEFIIIAPEIEGKNVLEFAEKIRKLVEAERFDKNINLTMSIGVSEYSDDSETEPIINRADKALYRAKDKGRNRVEKC